MLGVVVAVAVVLGVVVVVVVVLGVGVGGVVAVGAGMNAAARLLLLLCLLALPAWADQPANFTTLVIRDRASFATNPPPREPTADEKLLAEAVRLIDLARLACDYSKPEAQRKVWARQFMEQTDPVARPVDLNAAP